MNYGFVIDNRKCIGCHACTVACKAEHDVPLGVNRTWVKYIEKGEFPDARRFFSVLRCNHCADAPCVTICPVTSLYTREDGIVDFDPNRCIGCKACMQACPYDALYIDPNSHTAAKCNFCAHRIEVNLEPPCAVVCPEHAIIAGDLDDPATEISQLVRLQQIQVRKPEKGTNPKVFYIDGDAASLTPAAAPIPDTYVFSQPRMPGVLPTGPATSSTGVLSDELWQRVQAAVSGAAPSARRIYDAGQTHQDSWGWKVSAYLWTKSIAAGSLMVTPFLWGWGNPAHEASLRLATTVLSLIFLALTGALLLADLKRPDRFLWVLTRPQWGSWLTRGSYILLAFGAIATGLLVSQIAGWTVLWNWLALPAVAAGAGAAVYTAFLFWQSKGRDLWQSPLLPLHLMLQAVVAGLACVLLIRAVDSQPLPTGSGVIEAWLWYALLASAALILLESTAIHQTADAKAAARFMHTGWRLGVFAGGVMIAGHIVPLVLLYAPSSRASALAAVGVLAGLACFEHLFVRAGQSVPLS